MKTTKNITSALVLCAALASLQCPAEPGAFRAASLVVLSGFRDEKPAERELYKHTGTIHSVDLNWDGRRILFVGPDPARGKAWRLFETDADGASAKTLLPTNFIHEAADCCWLPDAALAEKMVAQIKELKKYF